MQWTDEPRWICIENAEEYHNVPEEIFLRMVEDKKSTINVPLLTPLPNAGIL